MNAERATVFLAIIGYEHRDVIRERESLIALRRGNIDRREDSSHSYLLAPMRSWART